MEKSRLKGRLYFYPRPPRGGRPTRTTRCPSPSNFYPRPPRGGRRFFGRPVDKATNISIHALREEGDHTSPWNGNPLRNFYPRPPRGGRHLLRAHDFPSAGHFYPRPPRGGRPVRSDHQPPAGQFLSTPSARRATHGLQAGDVKVEISIHALREEGDGGLAGDHHPLRNFYPRPPRGGRRRPQLRQHHQGPISIHALREEGDFSSIHAGFHFGAFLSTPSARRATPYSQT